MGFVISAKTCTDVKAGARLPDTGYYKVKLTKFEDRGKTDSKGNFSYFLHMTFDESGAKYRDIGSCPFGPDGEMASALLQLDEETRDKKIAGMVARLKIVAYSAGIDDDYMNENGLDTSWFEGREAYIAWLERPKDTPKGQRAYGEIADFITKEEFEAKVAAGAVPSDNRNFAWRRGNGGGNAPRNPAGSSANAGGGGKMPPPPPTGGSRPLPPPPTR